MIKDFKDLEKFLKVCRKHGVFEAEACGFKFKIGDVPEERRQVQSEEAELGNPLDGFPTGMLTPEQLMFYSSGGSPEDDPVLQAEKAN